ncbi:MAG: TIR domain-containing protein [Bacteroidales bacterium]|nr:TIR domain-containing protein [Bacteroidales bacterium]
MENQEFKYDIALSFAGEDREYVNKVANLLKEKDVKVFYDLFEEEDLWGKDLGVHFDFVYRKSARYCIPFISSSYKEKIWTSHEIKTAISRAIESNHEYILPARFDNTEIDGIRPTLGFIDLRKNTPEQLANKILKKLEKEPSIPVTEKEQETDGNIFASVYVITYDQVNVHEVSIGVTMTNVMKEHRYFNEPSFLLSEAVIGNADAFYLIDKIEPIKFPIKLEYGEVAKASYRLKYESKDGFWEKLSKDAFFQAEVTTTVGERYKSNKVKAQMVLDSFGMIKK